MALSQAVGTQRARETVIFLSPTFSFPAGSPPAPQNIDLIIPLDAFVCPATVHFYIEESASAGGKRTEKETDLAVIQTLPIVTDTQFTGSNPSNTALIEIPRIHASGNTTQFGDSVLYIGRRSNSVLRVACSHPLITSGTFRIKIIEYN